MKKITKIICLVLAGVLLVGLLCGCSLFGKNTAKYRNQIVFSVGDQDVKLGKVTDYYISNYYNYASYISQGYLTLDQLFEMTMNSLFDIYSKVDKYTKQTTEIYSSSENSFLELASNMKFLNQIEANFVVSYIKYNLFVSLDSYVDSYVTAEVGKLATLDEPSTERDLLKYDDFYKVFTNGATTYAEYLYHQTLVNDSVEKYLSDFYGVDYLNDSLSTDISDYVFANATSAQAKIDEVNKRLKKFVDDSDKEIDDNYVYPTVSAEQYIEWQQKAIEKYTKTIKNSYDIELDQYIANQYEDTVLAVIAEKYNRDVNLLVEGNSEFLSNIQARFANSKLKTETEYAIKSDAFVDFIENLTDTSYIYDIPTNYEGKYIFVKNLLIPFTASQTTSLANYAKVVGGTETAAYKQKALEFAAQIVARDFDVEDEEADDAFVSDVFGIANGKITVKNSTIFNSTLFQANSSSGIFGGTAADFAELMRQYNTDIGQHKTVYEYVVRVGDTPDSYTAKWVPEFVDAANEAWALTDLARNQHGYSLCVSQFGVHVVYVSGQVSEWTTFDPSKLYQTDSFEYSFLKTYYDSVLSIFTKTPAEELENEYRYGGKIEVTEEFARYVSEMGFTYDFTAQTTKED